MITDDQIVALFAKANPVPTLDDLDAIESFDTDRLTSLRDRSSIVSDIKPTQGKRPVRGRRPLIAALLIVALATVIAVPLLMRDNRGSVAASSIGTTTTSVPAATTVIRPEGGSVPGADVTVMRPDGWGTWPNDSSISAITKGDPESPSWMAVGAASTANIYSDRCQWIGALFDPPVGPTVDDLTIALADAWGADATTPIDITLDGFGGKQMVLTVPTDVDFADCDSGQFHSWPGRYYQGPGQKEQLWILDVEGKRLVILATYFPEGSAQDLAELQQVIDSIQIEP